jgi:hypothetical protein
VERTKEVNLRMTAVQPISVTREQASGVTNGVRSKYLVEFEEAIYHLRARQCGSSDFPL